MVPRQRCACPLHMHTLYLAPAPCRTNVLPGLSLYHEPLIYYHEPPICYHEPPIYYHEPPIY